MTELTLRSDELEVVILPQVGGRIHRIRAFGQDLLRTPDDPATHGAEPFFWGAYVMAPWCNRAAPGPTEIAGRRVNLAPNFPDGTAIHGLVSSAPWVRRGDAELATRCDARGRLAVAIRGPPGGEPRRSDARARVPTREPRSGRTDAGGARPAPVAQAPGQVRVPAERAYASNSESPAEPAPVAGDLELRTLAPPADGLDGTWTALTDAHVELAWPDAGIRAEIRIETDAPGALVAVATPPGLDAIAVEPQTHGPDPFRRLAAGEPDPPALLPPGASMRLAIRMTAERIGGAA